MDYVVRGHLPVGGLNCPCIPRLYCAYTLSSACCLCATFNSLRATTQRLIYAFIYYHDKPGGPEGYLTNISLPGNVAKVFLHTLNVRILGSIERPPGPDVPRAQSAVGDSVVVWRWVSSKMQVPNPKILTTWAVLQMLPRVG